MAALPNMSRTELASDENSGRGWFMDFLGKIATSLPYYTNIEDAVTTDGNKAAFRNSQQLAKVEAKMASAMRSVKSQSSDSEELPTWVYDEVKGEITRAADCESTGTFRAIRETTSIPREEPTQIQKDSAISRIVKDPAEFLRSMTTWNESQERLHDVSSSSDESHQHIDIETSFTEKLKLDLEYATFSRKLFEIIVDRASCCATEERYHTVRLGTCSHQPAPAAAGEGHIDMFCGRSDQPEGWHKLKGSITNPARNAIVDACLLEERSTMCETRETCLETSSACHFRFECIDNESPAFLSVDYDSTNTVVDCMPDTSLSTLLAPLDYGHRSSRLSRRAKAELALALAVALYQTPRDTWLPHEWKAENIFLQTDHYPGGLRVFGFDNPFISTRLSPFTAMVDTDELPSCEPSMLSFAILLLEIQTDQRIPIQKRANKPSYSRTMLTALTPETQDDLSTLIAQVLDACKRYKTKLLLTRRTGAPEEDRIKDLVLSDIVLPLYREAMSYRKPMDDRNPPSVKLQSKSIQSASPMEEDNATRYVEARSKAQADLPPLLPKAPDFPVSSRVPRVRFSDVDHEVNHVPIGVFCDGNTYSLKPRNEHSARTAASFFEDMDRFTARLVPLAKPDSHNWLERNVRIAVIDSGIVRLKSDPWIYGKKENIVAQQSWVGEDCTDVCGHGTHIARQLLRVAPHAELFIAKVTNDMNIPPEEFDRIVKAIKWAVETHDVDIISLSLALDKDDLEINRALEEVLNLDGSPHRRRRIVFAAACNEGGNRSIASPARMRGVIGVYATDGHGRKAGFNPNPEEDGYNFSTLGVDILSRFDRKQVYISGTSYSTPIAAGIVANMLHFARQNSEMDQDNIELLHSYYGAEEMLGQLSSPRDTFDYICPWKRYRRPGYGSERQTDESLKRVLVSSAALAKVASGL